MKQNILEFQRRSISRASRKLPCLLLPPFLLLMSLIGPIHIEAADFPEPYDSEKREGAPMAPEEAARSAILPPGFHMEVFASEPMVRQPIGMCFDRKRRLWVAECYTYAENPARWNLDLSDRILILEDSDGDGKADKRTVFWDEGKRLTSVAVGYGGVWATCGTELLFIPDADEDMIPDGPPQVILNGFDAETIGHNIVNGLKFGPDGWLYGRHGITTTSSVGRPEDGAEDRTLINCGIWRYHPVLRKFEVFCQGGTNPWGMDWNAEGQLFFTNTVIGHFWHGIPGAFYERMFGAHLDPLVYEVIDQTADHYHWDHDGEKWQDSREDMSDKTSAMGGGHAHMGCLIYEGGVWPEKYRGKVFSCNLHGRRVNMDILERQGNGYVAHHGEDFLQMADPWFRGLDLITGPDGQVWMNDWSDTGECHDSDGVHRSSGRIYRIVYDGPDKGKPTPKRPDWLTARGRAQVEPIRYNAEAAVVDYASLIASPEEGHRAMGVRWLAEDAAEDSELLTQLLPLVKDPSGLVRLELASALQRMEESDRFTLASALCEQGQDASDRQQSLIIWYGINHTIEGYPDQAIQLALSSKLPTVTRLISRYFAENIDQNPDPVETLITQSCDANQLSILQGLSEGLKGWIKAKKPTSWDIFTKKLEKVPSAGELLRELSLVFGDGRAREELLAIVSDATANSGARQSALQNLLRDPRPDLLPDLKKWVSDRVLTRIALLGLALYEDREVPHIAASQWMRNSENRPAAIDVLVSRATYAKDLLTRIKNGDIPRTAIDPFHARQIQGLNDAETTTLLREVWGELGNTSDELAKEIVEWKKTLTPEDLAKGDPVRGKTIFAGVCGACHKLYGEGGAIGPDLTGGNRHDLDYLLGNIVNPNEIVPADYRLSIFTLKDGRVVSGVVPEESDKVVTVQTPVEKLSIPVDSIIKREVTPASLMPEGLLKSLGEESVRDLIAYLMSTAPPTK